jgi:hypothetical protein
MFKTMVFDISEYIVDYFCEGRVTYFAYNNIWLLGFIICSDTENGIFHAHLSNGKSVRYKNIISHHTLKNSVVCPNDDAKTTCYEFDGIHSICHCGYRPGFPCGRYSSPFPPSSCNILQTSTVVKLNEDMVGSVLDISKLTLHAKHKMVAYNGELNHESNIF